MQKEKKHTIGGDFEYEVIQALCTIIGDAYAVPVARKLSANKGKRVQLGTVHTILGRLEDKGFVKSHMGEATAERGGKPKRLYKVTANGHQAMRDRQAEIYRIYGSNAGVLS